jgi:hypothetical protein
MNTSLIIYIYINTYISEYSYIYRESYATVSREVQNIFVFHVVSFISEYIIIRADF